MRYLLRLGHSFARLQVRLCHHSVYTNLANPRRVGVDLGEKYAHDFSLLVKTSLLAARMYSLLWYPHFYLGSFVTKSRTDNWDVLLSRIQNCYMGKYDSCLVSQVF